MNEKCSINQIFIKKLQNEARDFLTSKKMLLERVSILPKEVESYCFNEDEFKDNSVHRNDLQKNNANHFYIHRWGYSKLDSYKGGNYAGIDFVVSNNPNVYSNHYYDNFSFIHVYLLFFIYFFFLSFLSLLNIK